MNLIIQSITILLLFSLVLPNCLVTCYYNLPRRVLRQYKVSCMKKRQCNGSILCWHLIVSRDLIDDDSFVNCKRQEFGFVEKGFFVQLVFGIYNSKENSGCSCYIAAAATALSKNPNNNRNTIT